MRRHLRRCAACQHFAAEITDLTVLLRETELVPLPRPLRLELPRRRFPRPQVHVLAAAGSAALAAAAAAVAFSIGGPNQLSQHASVVPATRDLASMRLQRAQQLRAVPALRVRVLEVD